MGDKTGSRLKVGLYIPNGDGLMSPVAHHWSDVVELAVAAEETGFDSVWVADHMIFDFDNAPIQGRWEAWSLLAGLAATTRRVEIGPLVTCMGFRNPALLAKMAVTVDEMSGGRFILALGAGWHEPEFSTYGFPFDHRVSRFEEGFVILRDLVRNGETDFHGTYNEAPNCKLRPRGPRDAELPLWIGSDGPRMLKFAAIHADGWNTTWTRSASEIADRVTAVDAACAAAGRDPATLARSACVFVDLPGAVGVYLNGAYSTPAPMSAREAAELLQGYADLGIGHVMLWLDPGTVDGVRQFGETLQILQSQPASSFMD